MSVFRHAALAIALMGLTACATSGGAGMPEGVPADAEQVTRTESNGDQITEYRIAGQLRAVQVVPSRGPAYFLYDRDGDGSIDGDRDDVPQTYFRLFGW
jgi:outer membrane biogenesis lipoprotein LolB